MAQTIDQKVNQKTIILSWLLQLTLTNINKRFRSKITAKQLINFLAKNRIHIKDTNFVQEVQNLEKLLPLTFQL